MESNNSQQNNQMGGGDFFDKEETSRTTNLQSNQTKTHRRFLRPRNSLIAGILLIIVAIGVISALIFSGVMYIGFKKPEEKIGVFVERNIVCGDDIVEEYNEKIQSDNNDLTELYNKIKDNPGVEQDPTCQAIIFMQAINTKNKQLATSARDKIIGLRKHNFFVNNNLMGEFSDYTVNLLWETNFGESSKIQEGKLGG